LWRKPDAIAEKEKSAVRISNTDKLFDAFSGEIRCVPKGYDPNSPFRHRKSLKGNNPSCGFAP
jgi:hypothetical protein